MFYGGKNQMDLMLAQEMPSQNSILRPLGMRVLYRRANKISRDRK